MKTSLPTRTIKTDFALHPLIRHTADCITGKVLVIRQFWNCRGRPPPPPVPYPSRPTFASIALDYGQWALSLGLLYAGNRALAKATASAGISFPSPLIGLPFLPHQTKFTNTNFTNTYINSDASYYPPGEFIQFW